MKRIFISVGMLMATSLLAISQDSPLLFNTSRNDIPAIKPGSDKINNLFTLRGGLSNFAEKVKAGTPVTIAFLGGSITESGFGYRLQLCKWLQEKYPDVKFNFINAGVPGTGSDLGAFRLKEMVLSQKPDLVFIEFSVNGGYAPAIEGIIRQIRKENPNTDICMLYSATEPHMREYQKGLIPEVVNKQESVAIHYNLPSVHMALEAAHLEKEGKLIWKGTANNQSDGKIIFSKDGLHPLKEGGSIYASAVASMMEASLSSPASAGFECPEPLYGNTWEEVAMYRPAEICRKHGLWKEIDAKRDSRMKKFARWFDTVYTSSHPKSTLSFAFEGDMFGLFDIGGPEMGQLEIYVDGQMVHLKKSKDEGMNYQLATDLTGTHSLNRFNKLCNNRYRAQYELIKVEPGLHQVTIKLSEEKADKKKILGDKQLDDIEQNPEKYDKSYLMLGRILIRGKVAECKPVKGLPKLAQQLKWEKKIKDYMARDEEQASLENATLVVGSSSIDLWKSLESDFPGHNVIRRGVSGTKAIDLYNYRHLLIAPFNPKRIIIYEGDNEIGFKWEAEEMMEAMKKLFFEVRRMKPDAEIYLVSIKPSPIREKNLPKIQAVNALIKEFAESQPNSGYIDIHTPMLNADGSVRPELFLKDGLHPAKEGYDIWIKQFSEVIK